MARNDMILWEAEPNALVPASATMPKEIIAYAAQLREQEMSQLVAAFESRHYEMATTFIWSRTMSILKNQLGSLGSEFVGEMLQRPDIDEYTEIMDAITDRDAISLAEDLGMIPPTECMRLRQAKEVMQHFAGVKSTQEIDSSTDVEMNPEEAVGCLRACVRNILGRPSLGVAQSFADFRRSLVTKSFSASDDEILNLQRAAYFYRRTTLSVLLALLKTESGAQLEHAGNNLNLIVPLLWGDLKDPEKWKAGHSYVELYSEGQKTSFSTTYLKNALSKVKGFDFVPENLRSNTFSRAALDVLSAHDGMNNYYSEPGPMKRLASLGSSFPAPAFPICMSATLSVYLGNSFGHAWNAQSAAFEILDHMSRDWWAYYLSQCLPNDRRILLKLRQSRPTERWFDIVKKYDLSQTQTNVVQVDNLLKASSAKQKPRVSEIASAMYESASGISE